MVTICDHLGFSLRIQLKNEIIGESRRVAFHLLVEPLRRHAVDGGQVGIQHHLLAAKVENKGINGVEWMHVGLYP